MKIYHSLEKLANKIHKNFQLLCAIKVKSYVENHERWDGQTSLHHNTSSLNTRRMGETTYNGLVKLLPSWTYHILMNFKMGVWLLHDDEKKRNLYYVMVDHIAIILWIVD
jgi:hypothetical protein